MRTVWQGIADAGGWALLVGAWGVAARGLVRLWDEGAGLHRFLVDRMLSAAGARPARSGTGSRV